MARARWVIALALILAGSGCIVPQRGGRSPYKTYAQIAMVQATTPWRVPKNPELAAVPEDARVERPDEAGAPAVILHDERLLTHIWDMRQPSPETVVEVRRVMRLDSIASADRATVEVVVPPGAELDGIVAETRCADGRVVPVGEIRSFELTRHWADDKPARAVVFAFPYAEPGAVVRWSYRLRERGLRPLDAYAVPSTLPVRRARYVVWSYEFVEFEAQRHGMTVEHQTFPGSRQGYTWSVDDLPWRPPERGAAPSRSGRASVQLAVREILDDPVVGDWSALLLPLIQDQLERSLSLPAAWPDDPPPGDPIEAALARVQQDLADGATPLPGSMDDLSALHRFRRGHANERAGALLGLLRRWDVSCDLIYTNPRGALPIQRSFPLPADGSRLLVGCGERLIDPGCRGCAAGEIAPELRGRFAIRITADDGDVRLRFEQLPPGPVPPIERHYTLEVQPRGLVAGAGEVVFHDADAARVRAYFAAHPLPPQAQADAARDVFLDGIEAERVAVEGLDRSTGPVRFAVEQVLIRRDGFARGDDWTTLDARAVFGEPVFGLLDVHTRGRPVALETPMGFFNTLRLPLPPGWALGRTPPAIEISGPYGAYTVESKATDGGFELVERLDVVPGPVQPQDWPALRDFLARIAAHRQIPTVLRRVQ